MRTGVPVRNLGPLLSLASPTSGAPSHPRPVRGPLLCTQGGVVRGVPVRNRALLSAPWVGCGSGGGCTAFSAEVFGLLGHWTRCAENGVPHLGRQRPPRMSQESPFLRTGRPCAHLSIAGTPRAPKSPRRPLIDRSARAVPVRNQRLCRRRRPPTSGAPSHPRTGQESRFCTRGGVVRFYRSQRRPVRNEPAGGRPPGAGRGPGAPPGPPGAGGVLAHGNGQGFGSHPSRPFVCCIMTGAVSPRPGQLTWPRPSEWPISWLTT